MAILVVIESPGKIATISKYLGKNYIVKATVGIFRDLDPKTMSVDLENNFEPSYIITKPDVVRNLKSGMKGVDMVYLATDLDREGESMSASVLSVLKPKNYKRLLFNEITKSAITKAIENATTLDEDMVDAQKARRILDRIFGYLVSPIVRKQIGGNISAGRVQSVATKLVVEKEKEIETFIKKNPDSSFFKVGAILSGIKFGLFESTDTKPMKVEILKGKSTQIKLSSGKDPASNARKFLENCSESTFKVKSVSDKMSNRNPAPPFTTSTLQQEANRRFGMSVDSTMKLAQKLFDAGYITYMRTDSVTISADAHSMIKKVIEKTYGKEYYKKNIYQNKTENTQNAHEAIRPTDPDPNIKSEIEDDQQRKLYKLIWQRTIASQMMPAQINITTIQSTISAYIDAEDEPFYYFSSDIEKIIFDGFLKVYQEMTDEPESDGPTKFKGTIPKKGTKLKMEKIIANQEFLRPPVRYTEASLVKKLEHSGIGRPSTFVSTIKRILDRSYIKIGNVPGIKKDIQTLWIEPDKDTIQKSKSVVDIGKENKKLIPTDLGKKITEFLVENFEEFMAYDFTANMEKELDAISNGQKKWTNVIKKFYDKLKPVVNELSKKTANKTTKEAKLLGKHKKIEVRLHDGPYGSYISYDGENYKVESISADIDLESAIKIISTSQKSILAKFNIKYLKKTTKAVVRNGEYGPYVQIKPGKKVINTKIPKEYDVKKLDEADIEEIISNRKIWDSKKFDSKNKSRPPIKKTGSPKKKYGSKSNKKN